MTDLPIACALDGAALARRQAELEAGLFAEAVSVENLPDGYRWRFAHASGLLARLAAVIEAERHCCRFLRFAFSAEPDLGAVTLDVTGPEGTREFLESLVAGHATHS
jgi:hypothetical protein